MVAGAVLRRVAVAVSAAVGLAIVASGPALAATSYPDDPYMPQQWWLTGAATSSIEAVAAWCTSTGAGTRIAFVDTGADLTHPDLQSKVVAGVAYTGGTATSESQTSPASFDDRDGHGTEATGMAAAATGNGQGIAAVAPDATAVIMQVQNGYDTYIYQSDVALAIEYAADHGVRIINVSLEPDMLRASNSSVAGLTIPVAVQYAWQKGSVVVLAAGNDGSSQSVYPNLAGMALVVGAVTTSGTATTYSNHGSDVNIWAPGGDSMQTYQMQPGDSLTETGIMNDYVVKDGTALATAMVSGTLALVMAHGATAPQAMSDVLNHAVQRNGLAELDAAAALGVPDSQRCGTPNWSTPAPTVSGGTPPPAGSGSTAVPQPGTTQGGGGSGAGAGGAGGSGGGQQGVAGVSDGSGSPGAPAVAGGATGATSWSSSASPSSSTGGAAGGSGVSGSARNGDGGGGGTAGRRSGVAAGPARVPSGGGAAMLLLLGSVVAAAGAAVALRVSGRPRWRLRRPRR